MEWMGDTGHQAYEAIGNKLGQSGEKVQQAAGDARQARDTGAKKAGQMSDEAHRKAQKAYSDASRKTGETKEQAYQQGEAAGDRARQMGQQAKQYADDMGDQAAGYGRKAYEGAQEAGKRAEQAYRQATESAGYGYERAAEGAQYAKEAIGDAASQAYEKAGEAGGKVTEPFGYVSEGAKGSWDMVADRVCQWVPGCGKQASQHQQQQTRDADWMERRARAMLDHSIQETKKFWKSVPPFDPNTMDPAKYVEDFQREMAYHYGTIASVPRLHLTEVHTVTQSPGNSKVMAPASLMFLPMLALLVAWMARRMHVRRRRLQHEHHSHHSESEKQGGTSAAHHQATVTPSAAMETNYEIMTALGTSLYTSSSLVPVVAMLVTLLELNGVSAFLVAPLYSLLLVGMVMHMGETIRESASHELPGRGTTTRRQAAAPNFMGMGPGELMIASALGLSGMMASYTFLAGKPFTIWPS